METYVSSTIPVSKLAIELSKYIGHSTHVAEAGYAYKKNASFMESLYACKNLSRWLKQFNGSYPTKAVCSQIIQNSGHLHNILPHPSNKSYKGSLEKINLIIETATLKLSR